MPYDIFHFPNHALDAVKVKKVNFKIYDKPGFFHNLVNEIC